MLRSRECVDRDVWVVLLVMDIGRAWKIKSRYPYNRQLSMR